MYSIYLSSDHIYVSIVPLWMRLAILLKMLATWRITRSLSSISASSSLYSSAVEHSCNQTKDYYTHGITCEGQVYLGFTQSFQTNQYLLLNSLVAFVL